jgi:hypothetical protein
MKKNKYFTYYFWFLFISLNILFGINCSFSQPSAIASNDGPVCSGDSVHLFALPDSMLSYSWTGPGAWTSSLQNPVRYPAVAGMYVLTVTDSSFNSDMDSTEVTVNSVPTATLSGLDSIYCNDDLIDTLTGMPKGGVFNGSGIIDINLGIFSPSSLAPGNYDITYEYTEYYLNPTTAFSDDFSTNKGWTGYIAGQWERNSTDTSSGCTGDKGPEFDHSATADNFILGYNIAGCYQNNMASTVYITSPVIDCSGMTGIQVEYFRWAGCEKGIYDKITFEVFDGSIWIVKFSNINVINDVAWFQRNFDVSSEADDNPNFQVRFGMGPTDNNVTYIGWNIDDLKIFGTDPNSCSSSDTATTTIPPLPSASAGEDDTICNGNCTNLTASCGNCSGSETYEWSTSETTTVINVCPTTTTDYIVTVTDDYLCTGIDTVTVFVSDPIADAGTNDTICNGDSAILIGSASGGFLPYSYQWNTSETTDTITVSPAVTTTYILTVTDVIGCSDIDTVIVSVILPTASISPSDTGICEGTCVLLTASGGIIYNWDTGDSTASITVCPANDSIFIVTVTDDFGCSDVDSAIVTVNPAPTADAGQDDTICNGSCTNLTASGGITYVWSTTDSTAVINVCPIITTIYTVTVTDANGCTDSDEVTVFVSDPVADAGINDTICNGDSTILTGSASGGFSAYSYWWSTLEGTPSITVSPTVTTTYILTVTDVVGCSDIDTVIVSVISPTASISPSDTTMCEGNCVLLTASGGITYNWNTGDNTASITVCPTNDSTFIVTVTDDFGCSDVDSAIVTVNPSPTADAGENDTICNGFCTNLTASGGITYFWSTSETTALITVCPTNTTVYAVTVTDANGCTDSDQVIIFVSKPIADAGINDTICNGDSTILTGSVSGGFSAYSYWWSTLEGTPSITVSPTVTTTYILTITDVVGCSDIDTVVVTVISLIADAGLNDTICSGDTAILIASATGGILPYSYLWSTDSITDTITVNPVITTTYTVTITDGYGCTDMDSVVVIISQPVADAGPDNTICAGGCLLLHATGGITYIWSTGDPTDTTTVCPVVDTTYTVTVTDEFGCTDSDDIFITVDSFITASAGPDTSVCNGSCINLFASGGIIYTWSPSEGLSDTSIYNPIACPTATTTYTVTASDGVCIGTDDIVVTVYPVPNADAGQDTTICDGSGAVLTASGGIAYQWNTGDMTASITVWPTNDSTFTVTVIDANGCTDSDSIIVTVNPKPTILISPPDTVVSVICDGDSITLTANGGISYQWDTGETTDSITVSPAIDSTYIVTGTDPNGCTNMDSVVVMISHPTANAGQNDTICFGESAILTGNGCGIIYDCDWSTGDSADTVTVWPTCDSIFIVTVTDDFGCFDIDSVTVAVICAIANAGPDVGICNSTTLMASGGISYIWSNDSITPSITVSPPIITIYTVTVTNEYGCTDADDIVVTVDTFLTAITSPDTSICEGDSTTLYIYGGTIYTWNTSAGLSDSTIQNPVAYPLITTTYTVTSIDGSCIGTDSVVVTVFPFTFPVITPDSSAIFCDTSDVDVTLDAGAGYTDYLWYPTNNTTQTIDVQQAGTYNVMVTDTSSGCFGVSADFVVAVYPPIPPVILANGPDTFCQGNSVILYLGNPYYTYLWNTGSTTPTIKILETGNYIVTVVDSNGCIAVSDTMHIEVYPLPIADISYVDSALTVDFYNFSLYGDNFQWDFGDGVGTSIMINPTYTYDTAGTYNVILTVSNSCGVDVDTMTITVPSNDNIEIVLPDMKDFLLYPNPTKCDLTISFTSIKNSNIKILISNLTGQRLFVEEIKNFAGKFNKTLNLKNYSKGIYLFHISTDNGSYNRKVIVN